MRHSPRPVRVVHGKRACCGFSADQHTHSPVGAGHIHPEQQGV